MDNIDFDQLNNPEDLSTVIVELESIASDPNQRVYVIITDDDKKCMYELNSYEASMMSFVFKGLHKHSHIQTIYQIFIKYLKLQNVDIDKIIVESKVGDVVYATITLVDESHQRTFTVVSFADAMILSLMTNRPLQIITKVWDEMDDFEDWDYENYLMDYDEDEDDD